MRTNLFILPMLLLGASACGPQDSSGAGGGEPMNQCTAPSGSGTHHSDRVSADTTWTAADSPHIVDFSFNVDPGATLTIEPCAEVRMTPSAITVNGKLVADGTPSMPITITADDASKPFGYIRSFGSMDFENVNISGGGAGGDPNGLGVIDARADDTMPPQEVLRMVNVTIDGSNIFGVSLRSHAMFTSDSTGLTIKNAALGPIRADASLAGSIPDGAYTGNGVDEILVMGETLVADTTWHSRGVPYRLGDDQGGGAELHVGGSTEGMISTLTLESGITIKVSKAGRILLAAAGSNGGATGALIANDVTLTSASPTPAAGDWVGLYIAGPPTPTTMLDGVHVEYAGGPSLAKSFHCDLMGGLQEAEDAAIIVLGLPAGEFVTNSTILASAGYGIDRGWHGDPIDFSATNTFDQVAKCNQSYPRDVNGGCPMSVPCE